MDADKLKEGKALLIGIKEIHAGHTTPNSSTGDFTTTYAAMQRWLWQNCFELIADVERYSWLRNGGNDVEGVCPALCGREMDAAIDAAIFPAMGEKT